MIIIKNLYTNLKKFKLLIITINSSLGWIGQFSLVVQGMIKESKVSVEEGEVGK